MFALTMLSNLAYEVLIQFARLLNPKRRDAQYVILLAGPGGGKGTVATKLAPRLGIPHLDMGKIVGREIANKSAFGRKWQPVVLAGKLIPDKAVTALLIAELRKPEYFKGAVLDGFPRTVLQSAGLRRQLALWGNRIKIVVHLDVPAADLVERLTLRRNCSDKSCKSGSYHLKLSPPKNEGRCDLCNSPLYARADQDPIAIAKRMEEFDRTFAPMLKYFEELGMLVRVVSTNAMSPGEVYEAVLFAIDEID